MKVLFIGFRFLEHSKYGGYDWITNLKNSTYLDVRKMPFGSHYQKHGGRIPLFLTYISCFFKSSKYDVVHFFYGDRCSFSRRWVAKKTKVVATVHLKSENFPDKWVRKFKTYDSIICLSKSEEEKLREKKLPAHFIPHGFNRPVFITTELSSIDFDKNKLNVCFLGSNYRDYDTFIKIAEIMQEKRFDIVFHALGQSRNLKDKICNKKNIKVYPHLNDDLYYSLIQNCDYVFIPLLFATANNALLEAQSLGIVSILPKIPGILDYACEKENIYYQDFENLETIFLNLKKRQKSTELIEFSKKYEWSNIYKKLEALYKELIK